MPNLPNDQICESKACPYPRAHKVDHTRLEMVYTLESGGTRVLRKRHPIKMGKFCYYHQKAKDIPTFAPKKPSAPSPFDDLDKFKTAQAKKYSWSHKDH